MWFSSWDRWYALFSEELESGFRPLIIHLQLPKGSVAVGGYQGYKTLLEQILKFFRTGIPPISKEETIEIFTFMKASNMSKEQNGKIITLEEAYQKGWKDARKLIKACNKK